MTKYFLMILGILFIGLKLSHIIIWTWFWILSPLLILILISILQVFIVTIFITKTNMENKK